MFTTGFEKVAILLGMTGGALIGRHLGNTDRLKQLHEKIKSGVPLSTKEMQELSYLRDNRSTATWKGMGAGLATEVGLGALALGINAIKNKKRK